MYTSANSDSGMSRMILMRGIFMGVKFKASKALESSNAQPINLS
jgi:hypothetical protein